MITINQKLTIFRGINSSQFLPDIFQEFEVIFFYTKQMYKVCFQTFLKGKTLKNDATFLKVSTNNYENTYRNLARELPWWLSGKERGAKAGDMGSTPDLEVSYMPQSN